MLKPSEIIRMAMNHPSYLAEDGQNWLCGVITCRLGLIEEQIKETREVITRSMTGCMFLRAYLLLKKKIDYDDSYQSEEYKQAAFDHWNKLIEKLEKEGK